MRFTVISQRIWRPWTIVHVDEEAAIGCPLDPFTETHFKPLWDPVAVAPVSCLWPAPEAGHTALGPPMEEHDNMDYFYQQVLQKDVTRRLQVGQDLIDYINDPQRSPDVEQDKPRLDKTIDELTGWVNASNFKVGYLYECIPKHCIARTASH